MLKFLSLFAMVLFFALPTVAEGNNPEVRLINRSSDENSNLNPAQIYEKQMLERKQQRAARRKSKRLSGAVRGSGGNVAANRPSTSSSSSAPASRRSAPKENKAAKKKSVGLSSDRGYSSLSSGMFVK